ncbi:PTS system mannose/fructose/sorbose family transporter subunit IID [Clostridium sp. HCS.1]|uniref:PTS system mannose/fructose/sorbose family transporter subunit IID n=2 Tax=Clostridium sp. HCS.1 TaxID=3238594 RepID=UPI003A4DC175
MMSTKSESKKLTKKDLMSLFWRAFLLPACYSMDRMQAPGFAYSIIPVLKKLYGNDKQKLAEACTRHSEVYNNTFACSPFVLGIAAAMEEEANSNPTFDVNSINAIKVALMGPLSGIGDTFFWGTFRIIGSGIGISLAMKGNLIGPLLFLIIYNIPNLLVRYYGVQFGYKLGSSSIETLVAGGLMKRATTAAAVMGLTVIGGMIASMVNVKLALVANFGQDVTLDVQGIFDEICPKILPLGLTFLIYYLLKKNVKAVWIMIGIIVLGIIGKYFGIL